MSAAQDSSASERPLWKTRQVARALGLSVSTVKRLVDAGEIEAARTSGRHRLIRPEEALRYAREQKLPLADAGLLLGRETSRGSGHEKWTVESLAAMLRRGRAEEARSLIRAVFLAEGAVTLADQWVRPAMEAVGHGWESGSLDVFQEHRATRIVESALTELIARLPRPPAESEAPLALGAGSEGDPYTVAGLLCELALREQGWDVMNLGANLPLASLARAVLAHQPRLVWITANHLADPRRFVHEYRQFYTAASRAGASVLLGGQALDSRLRAELIAAGFGERVAHLVEFARGLLQVTASRPRATEGRPIDRPESGKNPET